MPIRFRCYRCDQLLGVSKSKAGAVAGCPRCGAELIVPDPEAESGEAASSDAGRTLELDDLRPEDIRVEIDVPRLNPRPAPARAATSTIAAPVDVDAVLASGPDEDDEGEIEDVDAPPIRFEEPTVRPAGAAQSRGRDVVLPRGVVLAWTLFAIPALWLAFAAGVLVGHYAWRPP